MVISKQPDSVTFPPSNLLSDEPHWETDRHLKQIILLLLSLEWWWRDRFDAPEARRNNFYAAGNLTIYYSSRQRREEEFRGPDFFVRLQNGSEYQAIAPNDIGWLWSQQLELYLGILEQKLRFFTPEGELVPAPTEAAIQQRLQAQEERQRAELAVAEAAAQRQRAELAVAEAAAQRQRAQQAEAELENLRRLMRERGIDSNDMQ